MDSDVDQYCLRWKYHHSNLQYMFAQLLENGSLCDVTLACEGKTIRVHKIMLSACSAYFDSIFSKYEESDPIVILDGVRFEDVSALVEFMYRGEITVEKSRLNALIETAEELQVKGLAAVSWRSTGHGWTGVDSDISNDSNGQYSQFSGVKRKHSDSSFNDNYSDETNRGEPHIHGLVHQNLVKQKSIESFTPKMSVTVPNCDKEKLNTNSIVNNAVPKKQKVVDIVPKVPIPKLVNAVLTPKPNFVQMKHLVPLTKENLIASAQSVGIAAVKEEILSDSETSDSSLPIISGVISLSCRDKNDDFKNIVKMNDHIQQGGWRPHFWELESTKKVMDAIKNKKLEMKCAAELLGVTYGTLYGRYREVHGYLKQPQREFWHDVRFAEILGKLKRKEITLFTAADLMNISASVLANHLAKADKDTCDPFMMGLTEPLPSKPLIKLVPLVKPPNLNKLRDISTESSSFNLSLIQSKMDKQENLMDICVKQEITEPESNEVAPPTFNTADDDGPCIVKSEPEDHQADKGEEGILENVNEDITEKPVAPDKSSKEKLEKLTELTNESGEIPEALANKEVVDGESSTS